jgi:hypothetical protein
VLGMYTSLPCKLKIKENGSKEVARCLMAADLCTGECGILRPRQKYVSSHGDLHRKVWLLRRIGNIGNCAI